MGSIARTGWNPIRTNTDCHFQSKEEEYDDRILNIYLKIRKQGDEWLIHAKTTLEFTKENKQRKVVHQIFKVGSDDEWWIGSWGFQYVKGACLNMAGKVESFDPIPSTPYNILPTPEELGYLSDHPLVEFDAGCDFDNVDFLTVRSKYLRKVSEKPVD